MRGGGALSLWPFLRTISIDLRANGGENGVACLEDV
jgi:hypothetical protein